MATSQASIGTSYKTILLATDFHSSSEAALPYVLSLARAFDSLVIAAHAAPFEPLTGLASVPPTFGVDLDWQDSLDAMQAYRESHPFTGLRHEFVVARGDTRGVIGDLVEQRAVDLVVLGTHGRRGVSKIFLGSVAEQIFRTVRCPVLTVGPNVDPLPAEADWHPRSILFATEFAEGSEHALPHALAIADANESELLLIHAVALVPWEQQTEIADHYQQRLKRLLADESSAHGKVNVAVCFDLPALGILATARDKNIDLIVMGAHRTHFPRVDAHMPGTTACEVIGKAHCPVLTVRN